MNAAEKQKAAEKYELSTKTLGALARDALEFVDGNTEKATARVLYQLEKDKKLFQQVIEAAVANAVYARVQGSVRNDRFTIERSIDRQKDRNRVVALAEAISSCLLDMPLAGGKTLRDASRAEVTAQIDRYEKMAGTMTHRARWLRLVLQSVPDGKRVGSVMTEARTLELFEEARLDSEQVAE